jgi:hypothetical protein
MRRQIVRNYLSATAICITLLQASVVAAEAPPAPIPAQILSARRVFIGNAGGDEWSYNTALAGFGSADRGYNEFYDAMKAWGHYELVADPADADLIFEIRFSAAEPDPRLELGIRDPGTHALLWALYEHLPIAARQGIGTKISAMLSPGSWLRSNE